MKLSESTVKRVWMHWLRTKMHLNIRKFGRNAHDPRSPMWMKMDLCENHFHTNGTMFTRKIGLGSKILTNS
ncbi:MAG: hypothetical protein A4E44_00927 [Methanosaeta sp. PtaB.Bin018]|jgi:hypothetical protein|nr:MAG: hypothetical protein A4E44_00927 [Methanosaeta sp. PtaB.Bin018]OPY45844.1 MAG: hypothetical protein A4E46_01117 [Methanosaeta sp. PtaU1.Bin016]